ncbi:MAG: hypothetical protein AB2693_13325, partial [Candidatus Thiodiazotropha sp.]
MQNRHLRGKKAFFFIDAKCVVKSSVSAHVCDVMGENWTMFLLKEMHIRVRNMVSFNMISN